MGEWPPEGLQLEVHKTKYGMPWPLSYIEDMFMGREIMIKTIGENPKARKWEKCKQEPKSENLKIGKDENDPKWWKMSENPKNWKSEKMKSVKT